MDEMEDLFSVALAMTSFIVILAAHQKQKKGRRRRWWTSTLYKNRIRYSGTDMMVDMRAEPSGTFENFCRMSSEDFEVLLHNIGPHIAKQNTHLRSAIPAKERLAVTLRFLATGDSYRSLGFLFKMSPQVISSIVPEVCRALIALLKNYTMVPQSSEDWKSIAHNFEHRWNFPHCCGALDGKHIVIQCPPNSGSEYFNYKSQHSIVLMALCDANYCITYANIGIQGRMSDGGVFQVCELSRKLENNELHLPVAQKLKDSDSHVLPYVIVGDNAFPLKENLMVPYPGIHGKGSSKRIYNYRLSRARRVIENVFGIMASVFRIFRRPIELHPDTARLLTTTCVYLHNFLRRNKQARMLYTPAGSLDCEVDGQLIAGAWRKDTSSSSFLPIQKVARKSAQAPSEIRQQFEHYFITTGQVPWQDNY